MKQLPIILALAILSPMSSAYAQKANSEVVVDQETLGDLMDPKSEVHKKSGLGSFLVTLKKSQSKIESRLKKELNRYRISATLGMRGELILSDKAYADIYYQVVIEPNFRNGEQVRRDIIVLGSGMRTVVGGKAEVRLTASRVYKGSNAKIDAIKAIPYFLEDGFKNFKGLPSSTKTLHAEMKDGDTIRLEVFGTAYVGAGEGITGGGRLHFSDHAGASVSFAKEALFMVDVYRHSQEIVRVRVFGLKNRGKVSLALRGYLIPGSSSLPGFIEKVLKIGGEVSAYFTKNIFDVKDLPIDTMMVDYLYKFKKDLRPDQIRTEAALDELLKNIRSFGFTPLFNVLVDQDKLAQTLKSRAELSERLAREDYNLGNNARVRHLFKGRIQASMVGSAARLRLSALLDIGQTTSAMGSYVRMEDSLSRKQYYFLESVSRQRHGELIAGRTEVIDARNIDALVKSNEKAEIGELLDVVATHEVRDKSLASSDLTRLQDSLLTYLPRPLQTPEVVNFLPKSTQKNAYFRSRFSFGQEAFGIINELSKGQIIRELYSFLDSHKELEFMYLTTCSNNEITCEKTLANVAEDLGTLIYKSVGNEYSYSERMAAFSDLMRRDVFRDYLLTEFLISFVPEAQAKKAMGLEMQFSSNEIPNKKVMSGDNEISNVYRYVDFVRSVLNNRSFDLRLESIINHDGSSVMVTPELKGFGNPGVIEEHSTF